MSYISVRVTGDDSFIYQSCGITVTGVDNKKEYSLVRKGKKFTSASLHDLCVQVDKQIRKEQYKPEPIYRSGQRVRLIGAPNGLCEERGRIGDLGVINYATDYDKEDSWCGTPEGYSYLVRSDAFEGAWGKELWVHESKLEAY